MRFKDTFKLYEVAKVTIGKAADLKFVKMVTSVAKRYIKK